MRNNRITAITGMLLVRGDQFLQALEGPTESVRVTYGRILTDRRHTGARLVSQAALDKRAFGDWHMCARRLSKADDAILHTLDKGCVADLSGVSADRALRLLTAVREVQASTLARSIA